MKLRDNSFGQLIEEQQEHSGAVTGSSANVGYGFDSGASSSNEIRPATITYPSGRVITFNHGTSGGMDDLLNRITAIQDVGGTLAQYTYLGLGTAIRIDYTQALVRLDLWGGTSGVFSGFDLFGRTVDQRWQFYGTPAADVDRCQYGYDQNSNPAWKANLLTTGLDELYVYDPLDRLVNMQRGSLNSAKTAIGGALIVTALGRWIVSGNSGTHAAKLVDAATGTDIAGGSVSINTSGATAGQYLYAPLANPIPLTPSHGYYLMTQETSGGDQWYDQNTTITVTSDLTANNAEYYDTSYHSANVGAYSYGPPNLAYGPSQPAIPGQTLGTLRNNFTGWVGFKFTTASGVPAREMDWTLDPTGNWSAFITKTSGTTDLNQTRTSNRVNEITAIGGTPAWAAPAYDAAGNMTTMPQPATPTSSFTGVYDAWNRLVQISAAGTVVAKYQYDGRNRRTVKLTYSGGVLSETRHFYFTNNWRDIEERTGSPATMERQYVWGIRYVDELVCRDRTGERYYATQDANFSVTSICDTGGTVKERYRYDPYGAITYMNTVWGVIASTAKAWQIGHQGIIEDMESGLAYNRARMLHPVVGGFCARDMIYDADLGLYTYTRCNPINLLDYLGLQAGKPVMKPSPRIPPSPTPAEFRGDCGVHLQQRPEVGGHQWIEIGFGVPGWLPVGAGFWPSGWNSWIDPGKGPSRPPARGGPGAPTKGPTPIIGYGDPYTGSQRYGPPVILNPIVKTDTGKLHFGSGAGKSCADATCREIWDCIGMFAPSNPRFNTVTNNCRDQSVNALGACCMLGPLDYAGSGGAALLY